MSRVAVLVSGGVDSSVALMRLAEEGRHELTAFYLKIWLEDEMAFLGTCPWEEDLAIVSEVCGAAGVPLEVVSLQQEYLNTVVAYALDELAVGHTPSPDVMCNRMIKFGAFVNRVGNRFDLIASQAMRFQFVVLRRYSHAIHALRHRRQNRRLRPS